MNIKSNVHDKHRSLAPFPEILNIKPLISIIFEFFLQSENFFLNMAIKGRELIPAIYDKGCPFFQINSFQIYNLYLR